MRLSPEQEALLQKLGVDPAVGLSSDEATARREHSGTFNVVDPPVKCPGWVCCLLPCIKNIPSMKAFRQMKPEDAEILRQGTWVRYEASSLVTGDIIRMEAGDVVPADCVVLALLDSDRNHSLGRTELVVDQRSVTGQDKPTVVRPVSHPAGSFPEDDQAYVPATNLYWGGHVLHGSALAVTTAIGPHTLVAKLIAKGRFPPKNNVLRETADAKDDDNDVDDEAVEILMTASDEDHEGVSRGGSIALS